jgi:hypothetical protein
MPAQAPELGLAFQLGVRSADGDPIEQAALTLIAAGSGVDDAMVFLHARARFAPVLPRADARWRAAVAVTRVPCRLCSVLALERSA